MEEPGSEKSESLGMRVGKGVRHRGNEAGKEGWAQTMCVCYPRYYRHRVGGADEYQQSCLLFPVRCQPDSWGRALELLETSGYRLKVDQTT